MIAVRTSRIVIRRLHRAGRAQSRGDEKATLSRSIIRRIAAPNDETMFQDILFAEPIFQAIERSNGKYGCAHPAGTGWALSSREGAYQGGDKLPAQVSFQQSRDEQWSNCDYNAFETLSISGAGQNLTLSFRIANGAAARGGLAVSGTCRRVPTPAPGG